MDTITHGIVGALAGKALFASEEAPPLSATGLLANSKNTSSARMAIVCCTVGSIFPDIDIFAGTLAGNPLAIMEWHRNITHSLIMCPLWAALLAAGSIPLARLLRWKILSFPRLFLIYAAGLLTHIFLDTITNFGTMVWSPMKYTRAAWDWLFILDLVLTSTALVPQLAAWCYREPAKFKRRAFSVWAALTIGSFGAYGLAASAGYPFAIWIVAIVSAIFALVLLLPSVRGVGFAVRRVTWCRAGLALVCAYLGLAWAMHTRALAEVNRLAVEHHLPAEDCAALPLPPTLTHWAGLVSTPEGVWRTTFHEPGGAIERMQFYKSAQSDPHVQLAKKLRDVQVYLWFARFPVWRVTQQNGQTVVDIADVRFFREVSPDAHSEPQEPERVPGLRSNANGFSFEIVFDSTERIVSSGFKKPQP